MRTQLLRRGRQRPDLHCLCVGMPGGHHEKRWEVGTGTLCPQPVLQARLGHTGRLPPRPSSTAGVSSPSMNPLQVGPRFTQSSLWTDPVLWSSVQKGTQSKGNRPGAKGRGHQGSEVTALQEESGSCGLYSREPRPFSQALTARCGASTIFSVQSTKP